MSDAENDDGDDLEGESEVLFIIRLFVLYN